MAAYSERELRLADGSCARLRLGAVKTLRITVKPTGEVLITAPRRVGVRAAMAFANERLGWISARRAEAGARAAAAPRLSEGGSAPLWGRVYPIVLADGDGAGFDGEKITLRVPRGADYAARRAALLSLYRRELERELPALIGKYAAALGVAPPRWSLRDMRSRYGSCTPSRAAVRFALSLAAYPPLCLEYVAAHELTHLRVSGHGADFHELLAGVFPREAEARAMLRGA